jgi:DEAD/DEAH box helicase domain-containing protein
MEAQEVRDQNYDKELGELKQERDALRRIIREKIDKRHTLNFLTDEGLIPNYAFPEAGVLLRSIIYRKIEREGESEYETRVYEYERPAVSAISELAPANRFYAEGRNVTIDRIDLTVADVETWRLCDTCSHSALQVEGETPDSCPRCGSSQWSDAGQEHPMVRMRQVFATTSDRRSRTSDDSDERRPVFYKKQLLVDYDDADITSAFSLDDEELPFGFEFLSRVDFREINFGEVSFEGPEVKVAGEAAPRKGFSICRHCGKVRDPRGETRHTISCPARGQDGPEHFIQALYLYREFSSEAIRILLPETTFSGSERTLHSFIAALQLGLRKKFGGSIDHLRVTQYEEPIPDSPHRKRSLVLYDTVPGGTGYLKELMRSTGPLLQVFERALEALRSCPCNGDPDKDGCYRCLYAYRNSYDMPDTSRDRAVELLSDVLKRKERFQEVESLRGLPANALFDSELEARFVQALKEAGTETVPVELAPLIVGRKPGYFLKVGREAYYIEPQVELGESDHVAVASRADFVLRPARGGAAVRPIAVFVDGWAYHRDRIGRDLAQRMAITRSGRYLVWSLTWEDIERALGGKGGHFENLLAPEAEVPRMAGSRPGEPNAYRGLVDGLDPAHGTAALTDLPDQDSFTWFLRFLATPKPEPWGAHAAIQTLLHLDREITRSTSAHESWRTVLADTLPAPVVDAVLDLDPQIFGGWAPGSLPLRTFMAGREEAARTLDLDGLRMVCLLDDEEVARGQPNFRRVWNGVLRFHNLMQFLPSTLVLSTSGVEARLYDDLDLSAQPLREAGAEEDIEAARWREVEELILPESQPLVDAMAGRGIPVPEVGYELPGRKGVVAGMAEFAWPDRKLALLDEGQTEFTDAFEGKGWTVLPLEEAVADPETCLQRFSDD